MRMQLPVSVCSVAPILSLPNLSCCSEIMKGRNPSRKLAAADHGMHLDLRVTGQIICRLCSAACQTRIGVVWYCEGCCGTGEGLAWSTFGREAQTWEYSRRSWLNLVRLMESTGILCFALAGVALLAPNKEPVRMITVIAACMLRLLKAIQVCSASTL